MNVFRIFRCVILLNVIANTLAAFTPTEDGLYAVFDTSMGEFTAKLYFEEVPLTVASFVGLATGEQPWVDFETSEIKTEPFYTGITFHRVLTGFIIQAGSRNGEGTDGPGYTFPDEIDANLNHVSAGKLSMANSGPNSNGSQFFVTLGDATHLDGKHAVFGEIVDGMSNVQAIEGVDVDNPENGRPLEAIVINSVTILREGTSANAFDVLAWQLPTMSSAMPDLSRESGQVFLSHERVRYAEYPVFKNDDLLNEDWNYIGSYPRTIQTVSSASLEVTQDIDNDNRHFYRVHKIEHPEFIDQNGAMIVINIPGEEAISIDIGAGSLGTYSQGSLSSNITYYRWFEVGNLIQFAITLLATEPANPSPLYRSFQFYLTFTSATEGIAHAYDLGASDLLTNITFTYTPAL